MNKIKRILQKLFFYSSRQILRRKKSYISVFLTSIVLLTCVMTFLEVSESYSLKDVQRNQWGTHHAIIRGMYNDFSEKIEGHRKVESTFVIPYTSLLESSVDTSIIGRVCVETPEIDEYLSVKYIWGTPPGDGEIAVSDVMYRNFEEFSAGEENDLYFIATEMTYYPLKISGIYESSFSDAGYVFVNANTAKSIADETGSKVKYDIYFRCKNSSEKYIASVLNDVYSLCKFPDTEWQKRDTSDYSYLSQIDKHYRIYREYINEGYSRYIVKQESIPLVTISLPVIAIAAIMLASFVGNWMTSNSAEYGVLGAIGANRRQLCAISAGQVLFISLLASVPVILFSAAISNMYISVYNAASSTDIDYVFAVPWSKLISASLWFDVLSCFFTYLMIANLTREYPFILISGSFRSNYPFVKKSAYKLEKSKDRIRSVSLLRAMRSIKSSILPIAVTSIICIVCGVFFYLLIVYKSAASSILTETKSNAADMSVSLIGKSSYEQDDLENILIKRKYAMITEKERAFLENIPEIDTIGAFSKNTISASSISDENYYIETNPTFYTDSNWYGIDSYEYLICDENVLPLIYKNIVSGDPNDLFDGDDKVLVFNYSNSSEFKAGDKISISAGYTRDRYNGNITLGETYEFTVAAVVAGQPENRTGIGNLLNNTLIFSFDGGEKLGYVNDGKCTNLLVNFDKSYSYEEILSVVDKIASSPEFLRFNVTNYSVKSTTEKKIEATNTVLISMFIFMVFVSYCVMTYSSSSLKVIKMRPEIAIMRQIGADDKAIYKSTRTETYPTSLFAFLLTTVVILVLAYGYKTYSIQQLNAMAELYPVTFTPEYYAEKKAVIERIVLTVFTVYALTLPVHIVSTLVSLLGTIPPTKRILKESITDGIRKDTD